MGAVSHHGKTYLQGFRLGPTHTGLYNHRRWLEAWNFGFRKYIESTIYVLRGYRAAALRLFFFAYAKSRFCHYMAHGIIIIISYPFWSPFSSTEHWAYLTNLPRRRPLHLEWFWGSADSIPSFFLSSTSSSSYVFLGLPCLLLATTFYLRNSAIQPVLCSTCPNHLTLLVQSTTFKSWMPSFERRES